MELLHSRSFSLGKEERCEHVIKPKGNKCFRSLSVYRLMCKPGDAEVWNMASAFKSSRLLGEGRDEQRKTLRYRVGGTAAQGMHRSLHSQSGRTSLKRWRLN